MKDEEKEDNRKKVKNAVIKKSESGLPPSFQDIKKESGFSEPTCRKYLKRLEKDREII